MAQGFWRLRNWLTSIYLARIKGIELENTSVKFEGMPWVIRLGQSRICIGAHSTINSDFHANYAGINHRVILAAVGTDSIINIGQFSGLSGATIVAKERVEIGNHSGIGVNSCIYDTDFHVEDPWLRRCQRSVCDAQSAPVKVGDDVWIAANVIILKGVTIGDRSIIGSGSVVTSDVPPESVFAGNPARFIRKVRFADLSTISTKMEVTHNP